MKQVGLIVLSITAVTMLLVGASLGAEWLQPYIGQATPHDWFLLLIAGIGPGLYLIAQRLRRKHVRT
ncbi:MAG TPA: hypothetical protein VN175_03280 [Rhizomicrobium sp.]|jgi:hypothetical protein|nr:hypothetical protein [Rhizomicrobium sp.]